ncbi:protein kinase superfamily protein [Tasmannia lanceolata]|uniref:protein kinase superfamily protein n=1 Tax=Tasmannia lanceolata TaxID=3420 RepID=UPI0040634FB4
MDFRENRCGLIGDYILGPKIGSGSFAVVWRSTHRSLGLEVAIKEINKKQLNSKINESLRKEITILRQIRHPNIICLHEAIETADKIYLVLEYCMGGDLSSYIQRFGRVSEAIARHFMRQLAAGLQVLRENNLIHRDLKPQNLLLSTNDETPVLKIGDFGFARYLMPQGLADTLCGSPLYMAPEIIQNQKYDAKADLWSVGAILFQLVTGKPPFDGNNQFQLFQNILRSSEIQFPQGVVQELHPDCIDLCKSLLRQNPVERLTFEEFFNHKFMADARPTVGSENATSVLENRALVEQREEGLTHAELPFASDKTSQLYQGCSSNRSSNLLSSSSEENACTQKGVLHKKDEDFKTLSSGVTRSASDFMPNSNDSIRKSVDGGPENSSGRGSIRSGSAEQGLLSMNAPKVITDSLESIEKDYVLVNPHFASMEALSSSLEASVLENSAARRSNCPLRKTGKGIAIPMQHSPLAASSVCGAESCGTHGSAPSTASTKLGDVQGPLPLHPSTRLRSLHPYVHALSELAQKKLNAGLHSESFSVQLLTLAVWEKAVHLCDSWVASHTDGDYVGSSSANECPPDQQGAYLDGIDFSNPASVCSWAKQGFIVACERAENNSNYIRGSTEITDAMEVIYETARATGINGGVDELMGNHSIATTSYSKAIVLFSFILTEAPSLPLTPPFALPVPDQERIHGYILELKARRRESQMAHSSHRRTQGFPTK